MCIINMDLSKDRNLDFAIYSLMLSKRDEFTAQDLVNDVLSYQELDREHVSEKVDALLKLWVFTGAIQQHLDTFSVIA